MMGTIVSSKKQILTEDRSYPSESYAKEAKIRQAALPAHLPLVHKLQRKDAYDLNSSGEEDADDIREWYPAGVSPWHYEAGVLEMSEGCPNWMDDVTISSMELHRAAILIQRVLRGYQTRKALMREQLGATKIQRSYRNYKRRQSEQNLHVPTPTSYLKTTKISYSVAKGDIPTNNGCVWQHVHTPPAQNMWNRNNSIHIRKRSDPEKKLLLNKGESAQEIVKAFEVPINLREELWSSRLEDRHQSRETILGSSRSVPAHTMKREKLSMVEKDISFPVVQQHVSTAAKEADHNLIGTAMFSRTETWSPENSYSKSISPDGGILALSESRESEKSLFNSLCSGTPMAANGNSLIGSLPDLKGSPLAGNVREPVNPASPTKSPLNSKNSYPYTRYSDPNMTDLPTAGSDVDHKATEQQTINFQDIQSGLSSKERNWIIQTSTAAQPSPAVSQPLPVQVMPTYSDALEIATALENGDYNSHFGGPHDKEYYLNYDPQMHPVMMASHSLRSTISRGTPPSQGNSSGLSSFADYIGGSVQGTNYKKLMEEMRQKREIELQQMEAEKPVSKKRVERIKREPIASRVKPAQAKDAPTTSKDPTPKTKPTKESDSFVPKLCVITEDECCEGENSSTDLSFGSKSKNCKPCGLPQNSNILSVPNKNDHISKQMDPLIKLLYQEISEANEEGDEELRDGKAEDDQEVGNEEESEGDVALSRQLIERVRTAIIKRQLSRTDTRTMTRDHKEDEMYGKDSILIEPPDIQMLLKAAEFRGGIVRKLKHLTTVIRLDYHEFMNTVEQTLYYVAQQAEAALLDYQPLTLLLISSTVPKCMILRNSAKPGVMVHIYDFSSSLTDLLNDIATLLENFRPGAKVKNLGIVCKGGPGYFYLVKQCPVTPAKLRNRDELLQFWQGLGHHMSKLYPGQSVIHLMESNVAGNRQGENLLTDLEAALYSHQVKVASPLEMAPSVGTYLPTFRLDAPAIPAEMSEDKKFQLKLKEENIATFIVYRFNEKCREMLNIYFDSGKHKLWKMMRYTKLRIYK